MRNGSLFEPLNLPTFDVAAIEAILTEDLPSLEADAAARVQTHLAALGPGGETWIAEGLRRIPQADPGAGKTPCPFCAQDLAGSTVISHYRAFFSAAYTDLKRRAADSLSGIERAHGGDLPAAFERGVRVIVERRQFWSRFCDVPEVAIDTAGIVRDWRVARDAVAAALAAKQAAPLERMALSEEALAAVAAYETHRQALASLNHALQQANSAVRVVKERAAVSNPGAITADLARLKAVKAR